VVTKHFLLPVLILIGSIGRLSSSEDRLIILSPHPEGIKTEFARAFSEWHRTQTGGNVVVDWRDMGGAGDDLRFVVSEFQHSPDSIGIDLFFGGGIDPFIDLNQRGMLQSYDPPDSLLNGIPGELAGVPLYDPQKRWFGSALSSFGILKNDRVVRQMKLPDVKSWRDLAHPALKGWVGSGDPRNSGATHMVYESILQAYGWDEGWKVILGIGANVRQFDRNGSTATKACTLGNVAYSVVVDFYGFTQVAEAGPDNMSLVLPSSESILNPDCIAMLKGAPHRALAEKFIEFVLSDAGQNLWLAPVGHPQGAKKFSIARMAIRPELYEIWSSRTLVKTNPFRDLTPLRYDSNLGTLRWSALNGLIGATVIDRSPDERRRDRIPVTEAGLNAIASKEWKDPVQRNRILLAWQKKWEKTVKNAAP